MFTLIRYLDGGVIIIYHDKLCNSISLSHINIIYHIIFVLHPIVKLEFNLFVYSRAHKLFGHSRVFILTIMICVKRIIFSNNCISKRLKDRKLKLFS